MNDQSIVAIGDIHGCPETLLAMLDKLREYEDRTVVFVGDYIDRGPDSKKVVDILIDYKEERDCVFLRGNHEQMMLDALKTGNVSLWMMNGGRETLESYGADITMSQVSIPEDHLDFYEKTLMYYETSDYFFVHAGLSPANTIKQSLNDKEQVQEFLWERSHLNAVETPWEKTVVFGHTPRVHPINKDNMIGIDTGCVYRSRGLGVLTAVLLPEEEFIQQKCID